MDDWEIILNHCEVYKEAIESDAPHLQHLKKINPFDFKDQTNKVIHWNKFSNTIHDIEDIMPMASLGPDHSKFNLLMMVEVGYGPFANY